MKTKDIQELGTDEIRQRISTEQENLRQMEFRHAVGTLNEPIQIRTSRRLIARLKTVLNQKEQAA